MKTLIVDDEPVSCNKLENILKDFGACVGVESGKAAIAAFQEALNSGAPFNLITLDISMPEMDGTELLLSLREIEKKHRIADHKRAVIIMVTASSDKDSIITCIQAGCNDYIVKPFNAETICEKMSTHGLPAQDESLPPPDASQQPAALTAQHVQVILEDLKKGQMELPALPQISAKFKELLAQGATVGQIADLLKHDMVISAKLISVSNSVMYRGAQQNKTLDKAISRLGLANTKQYVDAISSRKIYDSINRKYEDYVQRLWQHSLSCAYASQSVAGLLKLRGSDELFTMGFLHDIGKLMLLQIISKLEASGSYPEGLDREALYVTIDEHHCRFGAMLFKRWGFSQAYGDIALKHDDAKISAGAPQELITVHFANMLVNAMGYGFEGRPTPDPEQASSAGLLKLDPALLDRIKQDVQTHMEGVKDILA